MRVQSAAAMGGSGRSDKSSLVEDHLGSKPRWKMGEIVAPSIVLLMDNKMQCFRKHLKRAPRSGLILLCGQQNGMDVCVCACVCVCVCVRVRACACDEIK